MRALEDLIHQRFGRFLPMRLVARGGMGAVLEGYDDIFGEVEEKFVEGDIGWLQTRKDVTGVPEDEYILRPEHKRTIAEKVEALRQDFLHSSGKARRGLYDSYALALGYDPNDLRHAIKVLSLNLPANLPDEDKKKKLAEARSRFMRESEIMQKELQHENIVKVSETGSVLDTPYFVMEYVPHIPLKKAFFDDRASTVKVGHIEISVENACNIVTSTLDALIYAYTKGFVHRDVKPENILVTPDLKKVKVTDFGLVKSVDNQDYETMTSPDGRLMGTTLYLAPEKIGAFMEKKTGTSDLQSMAKSDVYSLGATLYFLLTGKHTVPEDYGDTPLDMCRFVYLNDIVWPRQHNPRIPEGLEDICMLMLAKGPQYRPDLLMNREMLRKYIGGKPLDLTTSVEQAKADKKTKAFGSARKAADGNEKAALTTSRDDARERLKYFIRARDFYEKCLAKGDLSLRDKMIECSCRAELERLRLKKSGVNLEAERNRKKKRSIVTGGIGALLLATGIGGCSLIRHHQWNSALDDYVTQIEQSISDEDIDSAHAAYDMALSHIADEPRSSEAFQTVSALDEKIDALEVTLSDRDLFSRISGAFEQARRFLDDDRYDSARDSLERALALVDDLSDAHGYGSLVSSVRSFSCVIDDQENFDGLCELYDSALSDLDSDSVENAVELAGRLSDPGLRSQSDELRYDLAESLFEKFSVYMQEREFSSASSTVEIIDAVIEDFDHEGVSELRASFVEQKNVLRQYETHIRVYNGLMDQVDSELELIEQYESQLSEGELVEEESISQLSTRLSNILMMLNDPVAMNPEAIGRRLDSSVQRINGLITERIPQLQEQYNDVAVDHYSSVLDELESGIVRDYTQDVDYSALLLRLSGLDVPDSLSGRVSSLNDELSALRSSREDFLGWRQSGSDEDKLSLMRSYLLFGHLDEAAGLARSLDMQEYVGLISLHRSVFDEANFVRRTEDGLTESMVVGLQDYISVYRQTGSYSNLVDVLSMVERAGLDIGGVDEDLIAGEATVDELMSVYQAARSAVENGYRGPDPYSVRRLAEAYRALDLDEAIENFEED